MKQLSLILFSILILTSCAETEPVSPDDFINQDVNGELFPPLRADLDGLTFRTKDATCEFVGGELKILGVSNYIAKASMGIYNYDIQPGIYLGNSSGRTRVEISRNGVFYSSSWPGDSNRFVLNITTMDTVKMTISGTFEGILKSQNPNDSIILRKGAFNDVPINNSVSGIMEAKREGGSNFVFNDCRYFPYLGAYFINALNANQELISIRFIEPAGKGVYFFPGADASFTYNADISGSNNQQLVYYAVSGSMEISEINSTLMTGSFNVKVVNGLADTINFQMGTFTAEL